MDGIPIGLKGLALIVALLVAVELGYRTHGRAVARGWLKVDEPTGWDTLVGGALTLLAFLLSLTVSMAVNHFEQRRLLVVEEANAISTAYLRSQFLSEPAADDATARIARYARDRTKMIRASEDPSRMAQMAAVETADQDGLWHVLRSALKQPENASLTNTLLQATNEMFDLADTRRASLEAPLPRRVLSFLVAYAIMTSAMVGFGLAERGGSRRVVGSTAFFFMIAMAVVLIMDIDHPSSGGIRVSEVPMDRVSAAIDRLESAKSAATPGGMGGAK